MGPDDAFAFAVGSALASMYSTMLQHETDSIGKRQQKIDSVTRLVSLFTVSAIIVHSYAEEIRHHNIYYVLGVLGFMTYKMSLMHSMKS